MSKKIHQKQINQYIKVRPTYEDFAKLLAKVLKQACSISLPEAVIQTRAKTVSSFAEKCLRKYPKVQDAVHEFTDLCGVRVIVQTQQQVEAVKQFIEANFIICEKDDKATQLNEDRFGYRDMHYIVRLDPDRCERIGALPKDKSRFRKLNAEIQVRTWLQHGWADTLHDRLYKSPLPTSQETRRTGALLAALMEEGDLTFDRMANELDGMIANFTAFAPRDQVQNEIEIQTILLTNELDEENKPVLALKLAKLLVSCGDYAKIIEVLHPYRDVDNANRCELLQELGYAMCKNNIDRPQSADYQNGVDLLRESLALCDSQHRFIANLRKSENLHARAFARLGWAIKNVKGKKAKAREYWRQAHECEPRNPYYLAEMLGFEMQFTPSFDLTAAMRTTLREAVKICRAHALANVELPYAYFTAGRLLLLLDEGLHKNEAGKMRESYSALDYYTRGIHHILFGQHCFPGEILQNEREWIENIHEGREDNRPDHFTWALTLLQLAEDENQKKKAKSEKKQELASNWKTLIITGGAASMSAKTLTKIRPLVEAAMAPLMKGAPLPFTGKIISGGTVSGVPGCVGDIYSTLGGKGENKFELIGYISHNLPSDAPRDVRYDRVIKCGESQFAPDQLLKMWSDLLCEGISPQDVLCIGFGGGPLSAVEYHMALAFGATTAVVSSTGGTADELIADKMWAGISALLPIPPDVDTVRALVMRPKKRFKDESILDKMAKSFHENYVAESSSKLPDTLKPWDKLPETYKKANLEQAKFSVEILTAHGFGVKCSSAPTIFKDFLPEEIEQMAKMEHGRWNIERLRDGWRLGARDDYKKLHPNLTEWEKIPDGEDGVRKYDREFIRKFPEILAKIGFEVYRM